MIEKVVDRDFGLKPDQNNENALNTLNTLKKTHTHTQYIYIYIHIHIHIYVIDQKWKEILSEPPVLAFKRNKNLRHIIGGSKVFL